MRSILGVQVQPESAFKLIRIRNQSLDLKKPLDVTHLRRNPYRPPSVQSLGVASCVGGPMRLYGIAAVMMRAEFARQKQGRLPIQWRMLYPGYRGSKEETLAKLNKAIRQYTETGP
jgi:hypothetical protein